MSSLIRTAIKLVTVNRALVCEPFSMYLMMLLSLWDISLSAYERDDFIFEHRVSLSLKNYDMDDVIKLASLSLFAMAVTQNRNIACHWLVIRHGATGQ